MMRGIVVTETKFTV